MNANSALEHQEGGNHYKDLPIQPVEYIHANQIGYFEGNVIKYVSRWKAKNGIADLRKARHYLDLLIELEEAKAVNHVSDERQQPLWLCEPDEYCASTCALGTVGCSIDHGVEVKDQDPLAVVREYMALCDKQAQEIAALVKQIDHLNVQLGLKSMGAGYHRDRDGIGLGLGG